MDSTPPSPNSLARRGATPGWWVVLAAFVAVVALLVVTEATAPDPRSPHGPLPRTASGPAADVRLRASGPMTTSTTSVLPAPAVAPALADTTLLVPEDVPAPSLRRPIQIIGRIQIPKIGVDADLRDQITQESIDLGPSHWPGTAAPGGYGNAVIAGHRSSHSAPFRDLGALVAGDVILLHDQAGHGFTYRVTEMFVVNPDAMWITNQAPGRTLTIFTCHPIGSSAQRLVVRAMLA